MTNRPVVIAVGSQKGGCGKTTMSVNLAAMANTRGLSAVVFDLDPQGSALMWGDVRSNDDVVVMPAQYMRLQKLIATSGEHGVDIVIMDIPPKASEAAMAGFDAADIVLIPVIPEIYDLAALDQAVKLARVNQKEPFIVINKAPQAGSETREAMEWVKAQGYQLCPEIIRSRKPIAQAQAEGKGTEEFADSLMAKKEARSHHINAAAEMTALYDWVAKVASLGQGINKPALAKSA